MPEKTCRVCIMLYAAVVEPDKYYCVMHDLEDMPPDSEPCGDITTLEDVATEKANDEAAMRAGKNV